jgi:hypothetical protein
VVLENFKVGGLKRYGLDYESLQRIIGLSEQEIEALRQSSVIS